MLHSPAPRSIPFFLLLTYLVIGNIPADGVAAEPTDILVHKRIGEVELTLHMFYPEGHSPEDERPAIVFFFGGGWYGGTPERFYTHANYMASQGIVAICADYRTESRHQTTPYESVRDGKSAVRWVRAHASGLGINPQQIAAGGGSAGGHVAACTGILSDFEEEGEDLSVSSCPNALLLLGPVISTAPGTAGHQRIVGSWEAISPLLNVHADVPPTLLLQGASDRTTPRVDAEAFAEAMEAAGAPCEIEIYPGRHGFYKQGEKHHAANERMRTFLVSLGWLE